MKGPPPCNHDISVKLTKLISAYNQPNLMKHTSVIGGGSYQVKSASMYLYVAYVAPQAHLCVLVNYIPASHPSPFQGPKPSKEVRNMETMQ